MSRNDIICTLTAFDEITKFYNSSQLPIFINRDKNGITHINLGNSSVVAYDQCAIVHRETKLAKEFIYSVIIKNIKLQILRDRYDKVRSVDNDNHTCSRFITLESMCYRVLLEKIRRKQTYNEICRILPQIQPVFTPDPIYLPPMCCGTPINIELCYNQKWIDNMISELKEAEYYYNDSAIFVHRYKIWVLDSEFDHICNAVYTCAKPWEEYPPDSYQKIHINMCDIPLHINQLNNLTNILENKKIVELHEIVHQFTDPLEYEIYNGIKYGKPGLTLE
jgi:hypothetical protein